MNVFYGLHKWFSQWIVIQKSLGQRGPDALILANLVSVTYLTEQPTFKVLMKTDI